MSIILKRAAGYKRISTILAEGEAHLRDPFTPPPQILKVKSPFLPDYILDLATCT